MNPTPRPYAGRLVFDHFPKTAGQAINAWLRDCLGNGTVSPNLIGHHRELLCQAGSYPVISGHVDFIDGEGLDQRYQYATLLREPIDRTISWLYFVIHNHVRNDHPEIYDESEEFLESDGDRVGSVLKKIIMNPMTNHYAKISGRNHREDELVEAAFHAIRSYDCIGTYDRLTDFIDQLAELIGIPAPEYLLPVNVTTSRPSTNRLSKKLRENLLILTQLDRELYARVSGLVAERLAAHPPKPPKQSRWARYDQPLPLAHTTTALTLRDARTSYHRTVSADDVMRFELQFELHEHVAQLQAGLHIFDDRKRWAFGVNNVLLGQAMTDLKPGKYSVTHLVSADLGAGNYSVGFAFDDVGGAEPRSLYWHDALLQFAICRSEHSIGVGYANCLARVTLQSEAGPIAATGGHVGKNEEKLAA